MSRLFIPLAALAALLLSLALPARADTWPEHATTTVNDYAALIDEAAETRLTTALASLRDETGIEATVLTLHTRKGYQLSGTLETFATGLFNAWGIGDATRNDGILILVVSEDREMRVELGTGYGSAFNREAQDIIDRIFLPAFKSGDFSTGIEDGTAAVITRIARVHLAGDTPPEPTSDTGSGTGIVAAIMALFAAIFGWSFFGQRIRDRFSRCPQCGSRHLDTTRHVLHAATYSSAGSGEKIISCPQCGYHGTTSYTIARRRRSTSSSSSSGGSFGGGSSSGGGASGRW